MCANLGIIFDATKSHDFFRLFNHYAWSVEFFLYFCGLVTRSSEYLEGPFFMPYS